MSALTPQLQFAGALIGALIVPTLAGMASIMVKRQKMSTGNLAATAVLAGMSGMVMGGIGGAKIEGRLSPDRPPVEQVVAIAAPVAKVR